MKEGNYSTLIQLLPDIIYKLDENGKFNYLNDAVSLLGYAPADLIGRHFTDILHPDDAMVYADGVTAHIRKKSNNHETVWGLFNERRTGARATRNLAVRLLHKGRDAFAEEKEISGVFHGEVFATGIYSDQSKPGKSSYTGTIGMIRDINELKKTEEVIVRTEKHYRSLIENSNDVISIIAGDGTILFESPSVKNVLNIDDIDMIGESIYSYIHDEDAGIMGDYLKRKMEAESIPATVEYRFRDGDNNWRVLESAGKTVHDKKDEVMCFVLNSRDITRRIKAEQIIRDSLKEKESLLKELHHRVKNNFQIIISLLNLQGKKLKEPASIDLVNDFKTRIRSMSLVHEKLYKSKNLDTIDIREYLTTVTKEIILMYRRHSRSVETRLEIERHSLPTNKVISCALLVNEVMSNSLKYAFPEGWNETPVITLKFMKTAEGYRLIISDNGIGMPEKHSTGNSTSLGLTLIPLFAEQMGGAIRMNSENGTEYVLDFRA